MNATRIILIGALIACVSMVLAQGGGRGGRGMMMGGGGGMVPVAFLLGRSDVQDDLKLTNEQRDKLGAMRDEMMQQMRSRFQPGGGGGAGGGGNREQMRAEMQKMQAEAEKRLATILTSDQMKRAGEIRIQMAGNRAVTDEKVARDLSVTPAQQNQIRDLMRREGEARRALMERARNGEIQWQEMGEITRRNGEVLDTEIGKILSAAQKNKLKEMGGRPFQRRDEN